MAADLTQSFWGKHFEKIVLAASAAIFVVALVLFVVLRAPQSAVRTDLEKKVERLETKKTQPTLQDVLKEEAEALDIGKPPLTAKQYESLLNGPAAPWNPGWNFVGEWVPSVTTTTTTALAKAPRVVPVTDVKSFMGRGTTTEVVPNPVFKLDRPALSDVVWVGLVGWLDLTEQEREFEAADALTPQTPFIPVIVSKVEIQRRELKPDSTWSDWKAVTPSITTTAAAKWPKTPVNPRDLKQVGDWAGALKAMQASIRHMPFYKLVGMDKDSKLAEGVAGPSTGLEQPEALSKKAAEPVAAPVANTATPAPTEIEKSIWDQPGTSGGGTVPQPPREATAPKRVVAPVWAYDASVEPGKTYQYQMRVAIGSPIYAGKNADPKNKYDLEFVGSWSEPTAAVSVPPLTNFYFMGTAGTKTNIELQRWILSQWVRVSSWPTPLGGPITCVRPQKLEIPGSPGKMTADNIKVDLSPDIVVVDLLTRFPFQPEGNRSILATALIYVDGAGRLGVRIDWDDKKAAANDWASREGASAVPPVVAPPVKTPPVVPPRPITPPAKG